MTKILQIVFCVCIFTTLSWLSFYWIKVNRSNLNAWRNLVDSYNNTNISNTERRILETDEQLETFSGHKIFFVETSEVSTLTPRQACAVESASIHNPSLKVLLLMTSQNQIDFSSPIMEELHLLPNVYIIRVNLKQFFIGTPLEKWYQKGDILRSPFRVSHMSDALRFLLLWRYGGLYMDMDIVVLRSMEALRNFTILERQNMAVPGIMSFDVGHGLMYKCVTDLAQKYRKDDWSFNGPYMLTNSIKSFCNVSEVEHADESKCGVNILPSEAAYPVPWTSWGSYFQTTNVENVAAHFNNSYLIHVWNRHSAKGVLTHDNNSLYRLAFKDHCPLVYSLVKSMSTFR